jgi:streptogrisin D
MVAASLASALVVAGLLPGWAAAEPALPTARAVLAVVNALPPTPNTAWGIDPATGQLVVTVAKAAPAAGAARLTALASEFGGVMRVVHSNRSFSEQGLADPLGPRDTNDLLLGGDEISNGKIICSAGFNVVRHGQPYLLTAGHCTAGLPAWQNIGPSVVSAFPSSDYGLIRDDSADARGDVDLYDGTVQPITEVGTAAVGEQACASGQTTEVTCGEVTAVDQTVDYGSGDVVHGLIKTNVHTDHGDSGGSLFDGSTGLGTVSGGDGDVDYFQPLAPALAAYGLELAIP